MLGGIEKFRYRLSSRSAPITVEDYRERARRAVPDMVWAYVDGGSDDLESLTANRDAYARWMLRSRVLTGNEPTDLGVDVGGVHLDLPVLLSPTGLTGIAHHEGELGAARAAERCGTRAVLSTAASYTIEEVAGGTEQDHWFQLYPWATPDSNAREFTASLLDRARRAGFTTLFVTVDVPVHGNREGERKRGMGAPPVITPRRVLDAAVRPKWWWGFLRHQRMTARLLDEGRGASAAIRAVERQFRMMRPELDWDDFAWMRDQWEGPLFIKGVLDAEDAERAVGLGVDGIVVSNHGGRQLAGAPATLDALPAIRAQVGDRAQVLLDGGIRRGTDIVKALCLGADAVCIGRPYVYGLAAEGTRGVERVISVLRGELVRTMTLMGVGSLADLDRSWLVPAGEVVAGPAARPAEMARVS